MPGIAWGVDWVVVQSIATVATAAILLVTVIVAGRQFANARNLRRDQIRPYVVADMVPSTAHTLVDFQLRNVGNTAAYDVEITADPPFVTSFDSRPGTSLGQSILLSEGLPTMPPGREIQTIFDAMPARIKAELPMRYDVTLSYRDRTNASYSDTYVLDLSVLIGLRSVRRKGTHDAAKALEDMAQHMGKWTQSHHGLRVGLRLSS